MTTATSASPFTVEHLGSFQRDDLALWNWFHACFPDCTDWSTWTAEVAAQLLRQPGQTKIRLIKTNLANPAQPVERIVIDDALASIGRDPTNAIVLPEGTITRQHAILRRTGDTLLLEDVGSSMGTLSAGSKLSPGTTIELTHGSEFVIFPHRFQLEIEREWSAGGEVEIAQPLTMVCGDGDFGVHCPRQWIRYELRVEPAGVCAQLAMDGAFAQELIRAMLSPLEAPAVGLSEATAAWMELLLLTVLERANRDLAWPFRFSLGRRISANDSRRGIAVSATLRMGSLRGAAAMLLPFDLLDAMRGRLLSKPKNSLASRAMWKFPVSRGSVSLTAQEAASIEPGDVVIQDPGDALLYPGDDSRGCTTRWIGGGRFEIVRGAIGSKREGITFMTTEQQAENPVARFEDLPLRVEVIVAEQEMTLAEAEHLSPGSILDLGAEPSGPVRLAVNGRVVGRGELVDVQGRLGVRILEWGGSR